MAATGAAAQQEQQQPPVIDAKFLPFIRYDRYGEGGWFLGPAQKLRLALLAVTLLPLRLASGLACVVAYYLTCRLVTLVPNEIVARRIVTAAGKLWSRACLFCLGFVWIQWTVLGGDGAGDSGGRAGRGGGRAAAARAKRRSVAVVSNHMGWADILIHMARYLPAFVARDGTQRMPLIGLISQRMQCIYVDREKKGSSRPVTPTATQPAAAAAAAAASNGATLPEPPQGGVSGQVKQRMLLTAQKPELELRPMLLFPEGTTTNGRYLLPFKTGAFLAGVPVLPTIIHYRCGAAALEAAAGDSSSSSGSGSSKQQQQREFRPSKRRQALAAGSVAAAGCVAAGAAAGAGAAQLWVLVSCVAAAAAAAVLVSGSLSGKGGVSPCWESINATRHLLLMLCQPFHTVECYELPLYVPSTEEAADPRLYASNVRDYMLRHSAAVAAAKGTRGGAAAAASALAPSDGLLEDKRRYQAWLRSRRAEIEAGRGLTLAQVFFAPAASSAQQQQQPNNSNSRQER